MIEVELASTFLCQETLSIDPPKTCQGSDCMAWRWRDTEDENDTKGYCGKVGRPSP